MFGLRSNLSMYPTILWLKATNLTIEIKLFAIYLSHFAGVHLKVLVSLVTIVSSEPMDCHCSRGITELHSWISRRQSRELLTQPYIIHKLMLKKYLRNHIDDVRNMMESQHGGHYTVYNLAERSYPPSK